MPRTSFLLDEDVLQGLKKKAMERRTTMQKVVNELLRHALDQKPRPPYPLKLTGWKTELQPGVDLFDRDKLYDLMDGL